MLLQRIFTAIPLAIGVVWLILTLPSDRFLYVLYFVALLAGFEWALLGGITKTFYRIVFTTLLTVQIWFMTEYLADYLYLFIYFSVLLWLGLYFWLKKIVPLNSGPVLSPIKLISACIIVPAAVYAMYVLHQVESGPKWLLYGLVLVWVADIGAYFAGKKFGHTKLAEHISPGKTKEGLWGAIGATSLYSLLAAFYFEIDNMQIILLLLLSLTLTLISVTGDLYESYLKIECGIKDSGHILPGHGGILDRIDSVLAAMPMFIVGCHWMLFQIEGVNP